MEEQMLFVDTVLFGVNVAIASYLWSEQDWTWYVARLSLFSAVIITPTLVADIVRLFN